jgi:hypothetical protein
VPLSGVYPLRNGSLRCALFSLRIYAAQGLLLFLLDNLCHYAGTHGAAAFADREP